MGLIQPNFGESYTRIQNLSCIAWTWIPLTTGMVASRNWRIADYHCERSRSTLFGQLTCQLTVF